MFVPKVCRKLLHAMVVIFCMPSVGWPPCKGQDNSPAQLSRLALSCLRKWQARICTVLAVQSQRANILQKERGKSEEGTEQVCLPKFCSTANQTVRLDA